MVNGLASIIDYYYSCLLELKNRNKTQHLDDQK